MVEHELVVAFRDERRTAKEQAIKRNSKRPQVDRLGDLRTRRRRRRVHGGYGARCVEVENGVDVDTGRGTVFGRGCGGCWRRRCGHVPEFPDDFGREEGGGARGLGELGLVEEQDLLWVAPGQVRDAKVGDLDGSAVRRPHEVCGLDVAVDDVLLVHYEQRIAEGKGVEKAVTRGKVWKAQTVFKPEDNVATDSPRLLYS